MSGLKRTYPELPGWLFELDEVSAGVHRVVGTDESGRKVDLTGTDFDSLVAEARKAAQELQGRSPGKKPS